MQNIVLSGHLIEDCELKTDKKGHNYIRFRIGCEDPDMAGKNQLTVYRCYTYNLSYDNLKKRDVIFITGVLVVSKFKETITLDVKVQSINRADEKDKPSSKK